MSDLEKRIEAFLSELKELEKKHGFVLNHNAEFVSYLYLANEKPYANRRPIAEIGEDSELFEVYE